MLRSTILVASTYLILLNFTGCASAPLTNEEARVRNERIELLMTRAGDFPHATR